MTINLNFFQSNTTYFILIRYICTIMKKNHRHSAKMIVALIGLMTLLQQGLSKSISTITSGIACLWKNLPYYSLVANCSNGQYHQVLGVWNGQHSSPLHLSFHKRACTSYFHTCLACTNQDFCPLWSDLYPKFGQAFHRNNSP